MTRSQVGETEGGFAHAWAAAEALDQMADGVISLDRSLRVLYANDAAARMTGMNVAGAAGRPLREVITQIDGTEVEDRARNAIDLQELVEVAEDTSAGRRVWCRFHPTSMGVLIAISESLLPPALGDEPAAAPALDVAGRAHYRDLLDEIAQGVVETTPAGDFVFVNRAFAQTLGYDSAEDLVKRVRTASNLYVNANERPTQVRRATAGKADDIIAVEVRRKDGSPMWLRVRATPTFSATGELATMRAILEESTERPLTQQVLREVSERIEERERLLLAEAIHDEPLQLVTAALLRLDSLSSQVPATAASAVEQIAAVLDQAMERLRRLIVTLNPPDLEAGLGAALLRFAQGVFIRENDSTVELVGPAHVPLSVSTKLVVHRIMREALINAWKHAHAQHVVIGVETHRDSVVLFVRDDGVGADTLTPESGHLGVSSMRARAQALGAVLTISSRLGTGTTVSLKVARPIEDG